MEGYGVDIRQTVTHDSRLDVVHVVLGQKENKSSCSIRTEARITSKPLENEYSCRWYWQGDDSPMYYGRYICSHCGHPQLMLFFSR